MTTKEQERKALEKIRKIVEELGPDSYIGMAFDGCFEIAEENISNDFGCSMKQRAVSAEEEAEKLRVELKQQSDHTAAVIKKYQLDQAELRERIKTLEADLSSLQAVRFSGDELCDLFQLSEDKRGEAQSEAEAAGAEIIRLADRTSSDEFHEAVRSHRSSSGRAEYFGNLSDRVKYIYSKQFPGLSL